MQLKMRSTSPCKGIMRALASITISGWGFGAGGYVMDGQVCDLGHPRNVVRYQLETMKSRRRIV